MARVLNIVSYISSKKKRKGIHAKSKTSALKRSKLYNKKYKGQGR